MNNPAHYHQSNHMQRRDAIAFLEKHVSKIKLKKNSNRILDIGCGDGSVTNLLTKYLPVDFKLLGIDINKDMVKFAGHLNHNAQVSFDVLDIAGALPEEMKGGFDYVFSFYTLHWVQNPKQAFKNIFDLLDENGECFLVFLVTSAYHQHLDSLAQNPKWVPWTQGVEKFMSPYSEFKEPKLEVAKLMESIGFIDVNVECEEKVFLHDDMHIFKDHFIAINPLKIPNNMFDDCFEHYIQILRKNEDTHGIKYSPTSINFHYKLLHVYGHKPFNK